MDWSWLQIFDLLFPWWPSDDKKKLRDLKAKGDNCLRCGQPMVKRRSRCRACGWTYRRAQRPKD